MLNPEKDDTDTEYAIREAIRRGAMEIVVLVQPVPELIMYWAISVCLVLVWRNR